MCKQARFQAFLENKKESQARRADNRDQSALLLTQAGIPFESKNHGAHLIVTCPHGMIDFWPGTGKWICRATGHESRGVHPLIRYCQQR